MRHPAKAGAPGAGEYPAANNRRPEALRYKGRRSDIGLLLSTQGAIIAAMLRTGAVPGPVGTAERQPCPQG
jgi:hypothetical protein